MARLLRRCRATARLLLSSFPRERCLAALVLALGLLLFLAGVRQPARADTPASGTTSFTGSVTIVPARTWSSTGSLATVRGAHTAVALASGKVLVAGGYTGIADAASAELYDPATGAWSSAGSMATARESHTAVVLGSGKVLVAGGYTGSTSLTTASAELYDPSTGAWSATGRLATARERHTAVVLGDGKALVVGGSPGSGYTASAELYDPGTGTWSATGGLTTARGAHTAVVLANGKVLVVGGYTGNAAPTASAELYDPSTGTWSPTGSLATARERHTAVVLSNGKVLVAGGYTGNAYAASAELYDPATGTWSATGSMTTGRVNHAAVVLGDGKVLVAGGYVAGSVIASAELYDPAAGTWLTTGNLATARELHTIAVLASGKALVVGGHTTNSYAYQTGSAELYDASPSNTFTGSLALPAGWLTSTTATVVLTGTASAAPVTAAALSRDGVTWNTWLTATNGQPLTTTWSFGSDGANQRVFLALQDTNAVKATVVTGTVSVDSMPPASSMMTLPSQVWPAVTLHWSGSDATSGLAGYDAEARKATDAGWTRLLTTTTATVTTFTGDPRATYYFRVRAIDNAGNVEAWPIDYDTATAFDSVAPTTTMERLPAYSSSTFTLAWRGTDTGSGIASYDLQVRDGMTGTWTAVLTGTTALATTYTGQHGHTYYFRLRATDIAGNVGAWPGEYDTATQVDTQRPTGTLTVNGGARATTLPTVTLTLMANDAESPVDTVRLSNDGFTWGGWLSFGRAAYTGRVTHVLQGADGMKTVFAAFRDSAGNESSPVTGTIRLDTAAGTSRLVSINNGALWTNTTGVTLTVGAPGDTAEMQLSNDGGFAGTTWQPFESRPSWTITLSGSYVVPRTVYIRVRDLAGNATEAYSDDIIYDPVAPTGTITVTLGNALVAGASTPASSLQVGLSASKPVGLSPVTAMRVGLDPSFTGAAWESYQTRKSITGTGFSASTAVYAQFRDGAGNLSDTVCAWPNGIRCTVLVAPPVTPTVMTIAPTPGLTYTIPVPGSQGTLLVPGEAVKGSALRAAVRVTGVPATMPTGLTVLRALEVTFTDPTTNAAVTELERDVTIELSYAGLSLTEVQLGQLVVYNASRNEYLSTVLDRSRQVAMARTRRFSTFTLAVVSGPTPRLFFPIAPT